MDSKRTGRRTRIRRAGLGVALIGALLAPATALATGTLDQQYNVTGSAYGQIGTWTVDPVPTYQAQTFQAGITGSLDQVDLPLRVVGNPGVDLTVEIQETSGGVPNGSVIGGATVAQATVGSCTCLSSNFTQFSWMAITMTTPASVAAGTTYAIVLSAPGAAGNIFGTGDQGGQPTRTAYEWGGGGIGYSAGTLYSSVLGWEDNQLDLAFKTYVTPPYVATVAAPINADGSSNFKAKGVVPVRFSLSFNGVATCSLPPATISLTRTAGAQTGPINEDTYTQGADTGGFFRVTGCQYAYNVNAKALGSGTYLVEIAIGGQTVGSATFELR